MQCSLLTATGMTSETSGLHCGSYACEDVADASVFWVARFNISSPPVTAANATVGYYLRLIASEASMPPSVQLFATDAYYQCC